MVVGVCVVCTIVFVNFVLPTPQIWGGRHFSLFKNASREGKSSSRLLLCLRPYLFPYPYLCLYPPRSPWPRSLRGISVKSLETAWAMATFQKVKGCAVYRYMCFCLCAFSGWGAWRVSKTSADKLRIYFLFGLNGLLNIFWSWLADQLQSHTTLTKCFFKI